MRTAGEVEVVAVAEEEGVAVVEGEGEVRETEVWSTVARSTAGVLGAVAGLSLDLCGGLCFFLRVVLC